MRQTYAAHDALIRQAAEVLLQGIIVRHLSTSILAIIMSYRASNGKQVGINLRYGSLFLKGNIGRYVVLQASPFHVCESA